METSGPCHWISFPPSVDGRSGGPRPLSGWDGFLAGPENRLSEAAVHWALGGIPFFADSPESAPLYEAVRRRGLANRSEPDFERSNSDERQGQAKSNLISPFRGISLSPSSDASSFVRAAYPLAPDTETAVFPPIIDYMPSVNIPNLSPLVFYGPSGTGKTFLVEGIYREYFRLHPEAGGIHLTGEEFYRSLTAAIANRQTAEFRDYFARCDLVVLEDLDTLRTRPAGQEELLAILTRCEESRTLPILTFSTYPESVEGFSSDLAARLIGGFSVPVRYPKAESRRILAGRLATALGVRLSAESLDYLVESLPEPAPAFHGAFTQMAQVFEWAKTIPSIPRMKCFLDDRHPEKIPTIEEIAKRCSARFSVKLSEMRSKSRLRTVVLARNMAIYLARTLTPVTSVELGRWFSGRDHTTILHGFRDLESRLKTDPELERLRRLILDDLNL